MIINIAVITISILHFASFGCQSRNNGCINIDLLRFLYVASVCGRQNNGTPKDGHILILGTYEHVKLQSKRDFVD